MVVAVRVVSYRRVSTDEQAQSGLGLAAQTDAIAAAGMRRRWPTPVSDFVDECVSGKTPPEKRPGLAAALEMLDSGDADVLVVAKLDRLARSMARFTSLLERADKADWSIVILDVDVDTTTSSGRLMANVMGSVAEWERMVISERTKAALAVKKASGVRLGRPVTMNPETRQLVWGLRAAGLSITATANELNRRGIVNGEGRPFTRSLVQKIDRSIKLNTVAASAAGGGEVL